MADHAFPVVINITEGQASSLAGPVFSSASPQAPFMKEGQASSLAGPGVQHCVAPGAAEEVFQITQLKSMRAAERVSLRGVAQPSLYRVIVDVGDPRQELLLGARDLFVVSLLPNWPSIAAPLVYLAGEAALDQLHGSGEIGRWAGYQK